MVDDGVVRNEGREEGEQVFTCGSLFGDETIRLIT